VALRLFRLFALLLPVTLAACFGWGNDDLRDSLQAAHPISTGIYNVSPMGQNTPVKFKITWVDDHYTYADWEASDPNFRTAIPFLLFPTKFADTYIVQIDSISQHGTTARFAYCILKMNADGGWVVNFFEDDYMIANIPAYVSSHHTDKTGVTLKNGSVYLALDTLLNSGHGLVTRTSKSTYDTPLEFKQVPDTAYTPVVIPSENANSGNKIVIQYDGEWPAALASSDRLELNGYPFHIGDIDTTNRTITLLGEEKAISPGLQRFVSNSRSWTFWYENNKLQYFSQPYKSSYAIIVAIDDYDRKNDPLRRGPTGVRALSHMVERATELRNTLEESGFEKEKIRVLFNSDATKPNIESALYDFWPGGQYSGADRVFFYFGGHGGSSGGPGTGYLVTYDFVAGHPQTGVLLSSIVAEHFPNIQARAVFVALDACSSGMALPGMLDTPPDRNSLARFTTLAQIRSQTSEHARNLLVAGTGDEPAIDDGGGIFTQALIDGLKGGADFFGTGVIQFDELSLYVENAVSSWAASLGMTQNPKPFIASQFGNGKVIFPLKSWRQ
jgi:hypothetical protein